MLRKILFYLLLSGISLGVYGQCSADPNCPFDSLMCASGNAQACVGEPYANVLTIAVPSTFNLNGINLTLTRLKVEGVTGLPAGITYACNPSNCTINGGSRGCVLLSGTANTPGTYQNRYLS